MNGELEPAGDRWRLTFRRRLAHPPEKVWRAIVEPEHRDAWFPHPITGELTTVGAPLKFGSELVGDFEGEVLAVEDGRLLEFLWGIDTIRLEIAPEEDGCTLTLTDTFDELGKAARDAAGWHTCLDFLEHALDGTEAEYDSSTRWRQVHPVYVEALGAEAAAIGPPEDAL